MDLSVEAETGRRAFSESAEAFVRAVDGLDEWELLGPSRCHGWTRLDVVVHVIGGWHEMLGGLVSAVDRAPTVDAASYWRAFAEEYADPDPVVTLMAQRRRTMAYARPASAREQLQDVAAAVLRGAAGVADASYLWQGHVFAPGDFLAVWAVEDVVHQLDLLCEDPVPRSALDLARSTIEALAGGPLPATWSVEDAVLVGTGRLPVPEGLGALGERLPALG
jgi:Mycothiol maleylpyruvate isomerase N-terminal domain